MKKAILSPLCSGLVIPGLGQIINQHLKKGAVLLSLVFIFFLATIVKLYFVIRSVIESTPINLSDSGVILDRLQAQDISLLCSLLGALAVIWLYSVLDAYLTGKKIDQFKEGGSL